MKYNKQQFLKKYCIVAAALYFCCMNSFFANKVIAVTGGSDGIGKALVEMLLKAGAKVSTCARNEEKLVAQLGKHQNLLSLKADVAKEADCKNYIERTLAQYGHIDILINNAGISMHGEFASTELDVFKQVMDINYFGVLYCTKHAIASIKAQKGSVVGVSSIAGFRGLPGRSGYSASKFALNGWLEALRTELLEEGVNVLTVCPGFTQSNIRNVALNETGAQQGESPLDESKLMTSEECAQHILTAIEQRKRSLVLTFNGKRTVFLNKFFPAWADKLVRKFFYQNGQLVK
jgi:short-subunit dehydrogenase